MTTRGGPSSTLTWGAGARGPSVAGLYGESAIGPAGAVPLFSATASSTAVGASVAPVLVGWASAPTALASAPVVVLDVVAMIAPSAPPADEVLRRGD